MSFKMHKIIFFQEKNKTKKSMCLKFTDTLPETHLFCLFGPSMEVLAMTLLYINTNN